jgi:hypothetical protein
MLVHKKVPKEQDAPHPLDSCVAQLYERQSKLVLISHTKRGLLRDSNSRLPNTLIKPVLLGASVGGWVQHCCLHQASTIVSYNLS